MSFILKIYDRKGTELHEGDIVRVFTGRQINGHFYSEVKWLEKEQTLTPFHTFSLHSVEKVDKLPDNVVEGKETRYKIWMDHDAQEDASGKEEFDQYFWDWKACEHQLDKKFYRIERQSKHKTK